MASSDLVRDVDDALRATKQTEALAQIMGTTAEALVLHLAGTADPAASEAQQRGANMASKMAQSLQGMAGEILKCQQEALQRLHTASVQVHAAASGSGSRHVSGGGGGSGSGAAGRPAPMLLAGSSENMAMSVPKVA